MSPHSKKRKAKDSDEVSTGVKSQKSKIASQETHDGSSATLLDPSGFTPLSLEDIRSKIQQLSTRVPLIPPNQFSVSSSKSVESSKSDVPDGDTLDEKLIREWATQLQAVLEEFNLLVCCVATATYKWGTDRSGAADQNLSLLSGELSSSQEQIASTVTPRLTNVLAPVVDLVIEKVVTTKSTNKRKATTVNGKGKAGGERKKQGGDGDESDEEIETRENHFTRKLVDPDFVRLCHKILARNAPLLRHVVLANFNKLLRCLKDYLQAQKNESQHDRGFAY